MSSRLFRSMAVLAGTMLFVCSTAARAQDKAAPKLLVATSSPESPAHSAFIAALSEIENIGGAYRVDPQLDAVAAADPSFVLGRAYYAQFHSGLTVPERMKQLDQAVKDAAGGSTAELLYVTALREWRAGRTGVARDLIDVVMKIVPDDPDVALLRVNLAPSAEDAVRAGSDIVQRFPDFAPAYNLLAYRLYDTGEKERAMATVEKYVQMMPDHPNSHDSYAELLAKEGKLDESDAHYKRALAVDSRYGVAHDGLAENAAKRGDYAGARTHLEASLALAPTPAGRIALLRQIATTYVFENNLKAAKQQIATAIQTAEAASLPASANNDHRALAIFAAFEGKAAEAMQHARAAASENPGTYQPVTDAILHAQLGHREDVAAAQHAMEANAAAMPKVQIAQEAAELTRLINAVVNNDLAAARASQAAVELPVTRAFAGAYLARLLQRAGDADAAKAASDDVAAYGGLDLNRAYLRLISTRR